MVPNGRHPCQHIMHQDALQASASQPYDQLCVGFHGLDMATALCVLLALPLVELQHLMNSHGGLVLAPISYKSLRKSNDVDLGGAALPFVAGSAGLP